VLAGEPVRLDPRDREPRVRIRHRPAPRVLERAENRRRCLVVDLEWDAALLPPRAVRSARRLGDVEVEDRGA
jgi:hypothetical protein